LKKKIDDLVDEIRKQTILLEKVICLLEKTSTANLPKAVVSNEVFPTNVVIRKSREIVELTQETLSELIKRIRGHRQEIIELRCGCYEGYIHTIREVATAFCLSIGRVRQLEAQATEQLCEYTDSTKKQIINALTVYRQNNSDTKIKELKEQGIHNLPVRYLYFSDRIKKCIEELGIQTVDELIQKTADELLDCKGFGMTSLREVREKLLLFNVKLKGE
jgi:DNA-directed RNA polymerase alpha subunit